MYMKKYTYYSAPLLIFILFVYFAYFLSTYFYKEGFNNYDDCVDQGYPQSFCSRTPIETSSGPKYCKCTDGYLGAWHMNDDKCYCYMKNGITSFK
jgi:hypothetical protein